MAAAPRVLAAALAVATAPPCRLFCSAATARRLTPQPVDLVRWVRREGGVVHPSLRIRDHPQHGLGIVATVPGEIIPAGTDLIVLPGHLPLRLSSKCDEDEKLAALLQLAERVPEELWAMKLGLRLLQERATVGSYWWPYISNLPEISTVPIFFPGEDIKNLQYAPLLYQVNKRCCFLLDFEKEVKLVLEDLGMKYNPFNSQNVDASSLGWAMSSVSSRAFRLHGETLPSGQASEVPMLLPVIDMCNHSFSPNAKIIQDASASSVNMSVKVIAEKQIAEGDSVTLNYGCLPNDYFLLDYGFVVPSNPYDIVEFTYDASLLHAASLAAGASSANIAEPAEWQKEILSHLKLQGAGAVPKVSLGGSECVDRRLLAALRVLFSTDAEAVKNHHLNTLMSLEELAPLGPAVEAAALRTIIALCVIALEHFPTKVIEDEAILKASASETTNLAVQFRMEKKLLVIDAMRKLSQRTKMLPKEELAAAP